jgi:hypothetical protein
VAASELANATRQVTTASGEDATVLDIKGQLQAGMMGPFSGGAPAISPPPQPPSVGSSQGTESGITFTAPAEWSARPTRLSQTHVFEVADGERTAEISISVLTRAGGELLPNINRWRSQLGMPPWSLDEMTAAISDREIGDMDATWVALIPEDEAGERATIGAVGYRGDAAWFFKMTGDQGVVQRERERFESFLKSIEFKSD